MKLKDYIRSISHVTAPYYNGDIRKVLIRHWGWLNNRPWGVRADLRSADLSSADLRSADLRSAKCFCLNISKYQIIGTQSHIIIGCQRWEWGEDLDEKAVEFNLVDEWNRIKKAVYACTQAIGVSK
jgi:hypothetical protein